MEASQTEVALLRVVQCKLSGARQDSIRDARMLIERARKREPA